MPLVAKRPPGRSSGRLFPLDGRRDAFQDFLAVSNSLAQVAAHRLKAVSNQKLFETVVVLRTSLICVPLVPSLAVRWSTTRPRSVPETESRASRTSVASPASLVNDLVVPPVARFSAALT